MAEQSQSQNQNKAVQTTGHAWDGDLQEFNNPLPTWWVWSFYATVVFAIVYWILYPAWPVGNSYTQGILTTTFENQKGEEVTMGWNARAEFHRDMQVGDEALKQKAGLEKVAAASYEEIAADPDMTAFSQSLAKVVFADNCAACHGVGGQPAIVGLYPNLRDDAWLWGGSHEAIQTTLEQGRMGYMPGFAQVLSKSQIDELSHFVLSLSDSSADATKAAAGKALFGSEEAGCYYCHTESAKGMYSQGSANLTDAVWTLIDVNGAAETKDKISLIRGVINKGADRHMPAWSDRLSATEIKLLTLYVHNMGGGE